MVVVVPPPQEAGSESCRVKISTDSARAGPEVESGGNGRPKLQRPSDRMAAACATATGTPAGAAVAGEARR